MQEAFWGKNWKIFNGVHSTVEELQVQMDQMTKDCKTVEEVKKDIIMGKLPSLCPQEVAEFYCSRNQYHFKTANTIQEKLDMSHTWKKRKSYNHHHHHERIAGGRIRKDKESVAAYVTGKRSWPSPALTGLFVALATSNGRRGC